MKRIAIILLCVLAAAAGRATTNFPVTTLAPQVDPNTGVMIWPPNWDTANAIAHVLTRVVSLTNDCSGPWTDSGAGYLTNAAGWQTTGVATNGALTLQAGQYVQSVTSPAGYAGQSYASDSAMPVDVQTSPDGYTWSEATNTGASITVRWTAMLQGPGLPGGSPVTLSNLVVYGWTQPAALGSVQDFAGLSLRVDDPQDPRDAVPLHTLSTAIAGVRVTQDHWSAYPAIQAVDAGGNPVLLDHHYSLSVAGDVMSLCYATQHVFDVIGGGAITPQVVSFSASPSLITMGVVCATNWQPFPEWSTNMVTGTWTRLATNAFTSTWPALSNSVAALTFTPAAANPAYYRAACVQISTNQLSITFRVPVNFDFPIGGAGLACYVTTNMLADLKIGDSNALAVYATTNALSALQVSVSNAMTSYVTTNALSAMQISVSNAIATCATTNALSALRVSVSNAMTSYVTTNALGAVVTNLVSAAFGGDHLWIGPVDTNSIPYQSSIVIGNSLSEGVGSTVIGYTSTSWDGFQVLVGQQNVVLGERAIAVGNTLQVNGTGAIGIGCYTLANGASSIAIGVNAQASDANCIQIGTGTNTQQGTTAIKGWTLLDASGQIPYERGKGFSGRFTNAVGWVEIITNGWIQNVEAWAH